LSPIRPLWIEYVCVAIGQPGRDNQVGRGLRQQSVGQLGSTHPRVTPPPSDCVVMNNWLCNCGFVRSAGRRTSKERTARLTSMRLLSRQSRPVVPQSRILPLLRLPTRRKSKYAPPAPEENAKRDQVAVRYTTKAQSRLDPAAIEARNVDSGSRPPIAVRRRSCAQLRWSRRSARSLTVGGAALRSSPTCLCGSWRPSALAFAKVSWAT
jgi:hypothetical protein